MKMPWKKEKDSSETKDESWKKEKEIIDKIFENTKERRDEMTRYLKAYAGKLWDKKQLSKHDSEIMYNLIFTNISAVAPLITDSKPITTVVPKEPYLERAGWAYTKALKYSWDKLDIQMLLYKGVIWSMVTGLGIFKIYFEPTLDEIGGVTIDLVDPRDFFIAPGYDEIAKAPYCGTRTFKPITWIKEHYPDIELKEEAFWINDDKSEACGEKAYKYAGVKGISQSAYFVQVYELWSRGNIPLMDEDGKPVKDKDGKQEYEYPNGKIEYFTENTYLGCMEAPDSHGLPPYVELVDYVNPGLFTPIGEADQIMGINKELNLQLQAIAGWTKRVSKKNWLVDTDSGLDVDMVKNTFNNGDNVYAFSRRFNSQNNPIVPIETGDINQDIFSFMNVLPQIAEDVSGVTDTTKGIAGKRERQSASELAILSEASNTRTRQRIRNLEWTIKRIAYILIRIMQEHYTEERSIYETKDDEVIYSRFGSSVESMDKKMRPDEELIEKAERATENYKPEIVEPWFEKFLQFSREDLKNAGMDESEIQKVEDYARFSKAVSANEKLDPVYFPFDIEIQTNSTLPMDNQSRANVMMRLFSMKAIDIEALLETLQIPKYKQIIDRMQKLAAASKGVSK